MHLLPTQTVIQHQVVDDAVAVLVNFGTVDAFLHTTASEAGREVKQTVGAADLKKIKKFEKIRWTS